MSAGRAVARVRFLAHDEIIDNSCFHGIARARPRNGKCLRNDLSGRKPCPDLMLASGMFRKKTSLNEKTHDMPARDHLCEPSRNSVL